jgi:RNase adaptor protein for sRNA GlmZ degradation
MIYIFAHGFKFGSPQANVVFDVSYFKNPWRSHEKNVAEFLSKEDNWGEMVESITEVISIYDKISHGSNVRVAICCNAGEHRSPQAVKEISKLLKQKKIKHKIL